MTQRKPKDVTWESWIERQIREAQERGEFDNLPGAGKPIPGLDKPHDPLWWCKQLLQREGLSVAPEAFALKKRIEEALRRIEAASTERQVRRIVAEINEDIGRFNRTQTAGPGSDIGPLNEEKLVDRWRDSRTT